MSIIGNEKYIYKNCPIPGGGYVTGFIFHEKFENILYIRTDIGGTYRFNAECEKWESLIDHVTMEDPAETFPIALALDYDNPDILYIASGVNREPNGKFSVSYDRGASFEYYKMPCMVHGNLNGRGTGYRLTVDRNDSNRLFFASQQEGLWTTPDRGRTWEKMTSFPEEYMTFVGQSPDGKLMIAAGAGVTTKAGEHLRGKSVYFSLDNGKTFEKLDGPVDTEVEGVDLAGHIAHRYAFDDKYMYITYSVMGRNAYVRENGYSCDGGSVIGGKIYRYNLNLLCKKEQKYAEDITPIEYPLHDNSNPDLLEYGFSGISTGKKEGLIIASTICKGNGDCIYRSYDYGKTWECVLFGLERGCMDFRTSYMKPEHNGGGNLIHWLTDLKINPFDDSTAWFNTGTGVFRTQTLLEDVVHFSDYSDGIEETVHLNLYSPVSGKVKLIDILGDLGGFAFTDLDSPCKNSFADENGNRYITCINADYSDTDSSTVIVTPRGNWTGKTKGGLIISHDECETFDRIPLPYGLSEELDEAFKILETPNVNSGWVAMSPDCSTIVWTVAEQILLPVSRVIVSNDAGKSFSISEIYKKDGSRKSDGNMKVFSDRVKSNVFYGFGDHSDIYISTDGGKIFNEVNVPADFPIVHFGKIDCANKTEVRAENGKSGVFYMALAKNGLWKMEISEAGECKTIRLNKAGDSAYRLGLGIGREDGDYLSEAKAIYITGTIDGTYGFFRTNDEGKTYVKLNDNSQMFGDINSMEGDSRKYGRFYIATGSRGVLYAEKE